MKYINSFDEYLNEAFQFDIPKDHRGAIKHGQKVKVFRNLNTSTVMNDWDRRGVEHNESNKDVIWSIRDAKTDIVRYYSYNVRLENVTFLVKTGKWDRQLTLATGQKNPHAFIIGNIVDWNDSDRIRKPFNYDIDTNDVTVHENHVDGWVAAYYKPYEVDRYVVPRFPPMYHNLGIAGRELISAKECVMGQTVLPDGAVRPFVYVLDPVFAPDYQNTDWSHKGVQPKTRSAGNYKGKHKEKTLLNTMNLDDQENILGKGFDK
jgi:hypothetical protein